MMIDILARSAIALMLATCGISAFAQTPGAEDAPPSFPAEYDHLGINLGDESAPLVVREFADYQCPGCRMFSGVVKQLIEEYVDTGKVRFIFFDLPLTDIHRHAMAAAEAARCAGRQGEYWAMHTALFEHQQEWSKTRDPMEHFARYASELDLDAEALSECVEQGQTRDAVMQSRQFAIQLGVRSTPTLVVGDRGLSGGVPYEQLKLTVERELSGEPPPVMEASPPDPDRELMVVDHNRMDDAMSPYLRMHGHNPVDWYPWGEEAFAKAREENKPIFLSIGYFTCYWCHVMERESFNDNEVADWLNRYFVAIKVDREVRPDVDSLYMRAIHVMGQRGGWPLSMFLTPEREPFFGGTYYPRAQLIRALDQIRTVWASDPAQINQSAQAMVTALKQSEGHTGVSEGGEMPPADLLDKSARAYARGFDSELGGFSSAPKFPQPSILRFLLDRYENTRDPSHLEMVTTTLDGMAAGGMYDHLGGGFHRYSTDARWRVPHFEKMLYDNAQLLDVYTRAWRLTENPRYRDVASGIVDYVAGTLTDPKTGLFYSAQNSLVDGVEGKSYGWTREQAAGALDDEQLLEIATLLYNLDGAPELEHGDHVLFLARGLDEIAAELEGVDTDAVADARRRIDQRLLAAREQREQAEVGTKHVMSWNAQMIGALAEAGQTFERPQWIERAAHAAEALRTEMYEAENGPLLAVRDGRGEVLAQLDDYAALVGAYAALARATEDTVWNERAASVAGDMVERLWNPERGLFNRRPNPGDDLLLETTDVHDGAVPAGNSLAALALTELAGAGYAGFAPYAGTVLRAHGDYLDRQATGMPLMLTALSAYLKAGLPAQVEFPDGQVELAFISDQTDQADQEETPGLKLEDVGHGTAASGTGSLFSNDKVGIQVRREDDAPDTLTVELIVEDGWHVNANPATLDFLVPTTLTVQAGSRPLEIETHYPEAGTISAEELGEGPISVYSGNASITARLPADVELSGEQPLHAVVQVQACNDRGRCLAPASIEQPVPTEDD